MLPREVFQDRQHVRLERFEPQLLRSPLRVGDPRPQVTQPLGKSLVSCVVAVAHSTARSEAVVFDHSCSSNAFTFSLGSEWLY